MQEREIVSNNAKERFHKYVGQAGEVELVSDADIPLTVIGAKAFLSCKSVEKLYLPDSLEYLEDWAFAHMKNLREITLPAREIVFGKKVFLGCDKLQKVNLRVCKKLPSEKADLSEAIKIYEGIFYFLASMYRFFPENKSENLKKAGDEQEQWQWLACYDEALLEYISRADDTDFEPAFIGWFDIEDVDDQKQRYILQQKKHKICLAFQRLLYSEKLSGANCDYLEDYLIKESKLVEELLLDKKESYSRDIRFFRIWEQAGGLDRACVGRLLEHITEEEPEIRGYLLRIQLESVEKNDFFEELDL